MEQFIKGLTALLLTAQIYLYPISVYAKPVAEYQLKAVFLYNFAHFVIFPEQQKATGENFNYCIYGSSLLQQALLLTIEDQYVNDRAIRLIRLGRNDPTDVCQIIYFSSSEKNFYESIISGLRNQPVLTVSEIDGFARKRGMIELIRKNNKISLIINNDNAKAVGLTIKANLLSIATIVGN